MSVNKMKYAKIKKENGTYSETIPIGVDAENVDFSDGRTLDQVMSRVMQYEDIAPVFNKADPYQIGDYVFNPDDNNLYRFTAVHRSNVNWDPNSVERVVLTEDIKNVIQISNGQPTDARNKVWINPTGDSNIQILTYDEFQQFRTKMITRQFNAKLIYKVGEYVLYDDKLYKFIAQHKANVIWNQDIVQQVRVTDKLTSAVDFDVIAPAFEIQKAYSIGDCVFKDQKLYKFITNHAVNVNWNDNHVIQTNLHDLLKGWTPINMVADIFDRKNAYTKQDYVIKDYKLYRFITNHSSNTDWNDSQVENVTISMELAKLLNPLSVAENFSTDKAYQQKDYVLKDGKLYRFITDHAINTGWRDNQVKELTVAECLKELSNLTAIAPIFSEEENYKKGSCVFNKGVLYQFIVDHEAGVWNPQEVKVTSINQRLQELSNSQVIAPVFNSNTYYPVGKYVFKNNELYRFKIEHIENTDWNNEQVEKITIGQVLKDLSSSDAIAPTFSIDEVYNEGDYVFREGKLYKFTADHLVNINWRTDDNQETSIAIELEEIKRFLANFIEFDNNHGLIFN